jgi:hypothetical protein
MGNRERVDLNSMYFFGGMIDNTQNCLLDDYNYSFFVITDNNNMTKCKGPHHDFTTFTTYDFTTFTTLRLLIDLETHFCTVNPVSISIKSRKVVKVVKS